MNVVQSRSLVVTEPGDSSVLSVEDRAVRSPAAGELLVQVQASGVNFLEIYQREGVYPTPTPFALGGEGAGRIVEVGADVSGFSVGDLIAWISVPGSHADAIIVPAEKAVPVPEGVSAEQAAAVLLQGATAHYLVNSTYPVQPGDSVLVHAAAGGVGQLLVQLAKSKGAHVVATASTAQKVARALSRGADHGLRYTENPAVFADLARRANQGNGFSVVYDGVGKDTFEASLRSLAPRGTAVLFGAASGQVPPFDLQRLNPLGSLFITRPTLADYIATREELLWRGQAVFTALADGALELEIGGRYALTDAARAYDDLQGRRTTGKLILTR